MSMYITNLQFNAKITINLNPPKKLYEGIELYGLTRSCPLFDWPVHHLNQTQRGMIKNTALPSIAAIAAFIAFTIFSLGAYAFYANRVSTDYTITHKLSYLVGIGSIRGVNNLFSKHPELKERKLMYISWDGRSNALSHALNCPGSREVNSTRSTSMEMIDTLLMQGFDINVPFSPRDPANKPRHILDGALEHSNNHSPFADRNRPWALIPQLIEKGAKPLNDEHKKSLIARCEEAIRKFSPNFRYSPPDKTLQSLVNVAPLM